MYNGGSAAHQKGGRPRQAADGELDAAEPANVARKLDQYSGPRAICGGKATAGRVISAIFPDVLLLEQWGVAPVAGASEGYYGGT